MIVTYFMPPCAFWGAEFKSTFTFLIWVFVIKLWMKVHIGVYDFLHYTISTINRFHLSQSSNTLGFSYFNSSLNWSDHVKQSAKASHILNFLFLQAHQFVKPLPCKTLAFLFGVYILKILIIWKLFNGMLNVLKWPSLQIHWAYFAIVQAHDILHKRIPFLSFLF